MGTVFLYCFTMLRLFKCLDFFLTFSAYKELFDFSIANQFTWKILTQVHTNLTFKEFFLRESQSRKTYE